ncbi:MAG TPA: flagellar hook-associated protein FlgK [Noviherbaspirillum sp.]|uniref:flagellar hook-associated protein FlgK n=1 Tax=Noviherbaspirillum sp. TaxID=1926288 RepID=UPI002D29774E|nr:flagellar hook-associated protein FlgK [Noviherbaspirillum sp.]HYD95689.1 flagellar hook-associated protein FlgK [Noviherbaspirillum sp.]
MSSTSILGIGQSALAAAQAGLVTTGHNIANVNTPGYTRQSIVQTASAGQDIGTGFLGKGTEVVTVKRLFNEFLNNQVLTAQTSKNSLDSYYAQMRQIDNMLADPAAGVASALQEFFSGVQRVASNPNNSPARDTMLSSAQAMATRFRNVAGRLDEMRQGVNDEITAGIGVINSYAQQIANLNDAIEKAQGTAGEGKPANDLLDQRDHLISELSKETKVTVVKQNNSYNVFIGNGQALTVGTEVFKLVPVTSTSDPSKIQVGYMSNGGTTVLPDNGLPGGRLGGLLEFRANSLEPAQNAVGRMAVGLAVTFNAQHQLGQDQTGAMGGAFFSIGAPEVTAIRKTGGATMTATISDVSQLNPSDYRVQRIDGFSPGNNYVVTRMSDGKQTAFASFPTTVDGVTFGIGNPPSALSNGDDYMIRPTRNIADTFKVAITDTAKIAAGSPARTAEATTNTGSGKIGPATVTSTAFMPAGVTLTYDAGTDRITGISPAAGPIVVKSGATTTTYAAGATNIPFAPGDSVTVGGIPVTFPTAGAAVTAHALSAPTPTTLTYAGGALTGFPAYQDIEIVHADGTKQTIPGASPAPSVTYKDGDTISFGGVSFTVSGAPANGDKFTISTNSGGVGDNRNALALAALQTKNTLANGTMTYSAAYSLMVTQVGNKTRELEITSKAEAQVLEQAVQAQQSESGVNIDEEAANLLRYQQAYQAAAKVMQTASQLFELLLNLGN